MPQPDFMRFASQALLDGFDESVEREWPADTVVEAHVHPYAVKALVVRGEMWLTARDETRHLQPGDTFELARDEPHAERYGAAGATYWAARRA